MDERIKQIIAAGYRQDRLAEFADAVNAALSGQPGEWARMGDGHFGDPPVVELSPLLLADLLTAAGGGPVRVGKVCFNGAPPCDHRNPANKTTRPWGTPYVKRCVECAAELGPERQQ